MLSDDQLPKKLILVFASYKRKKRGLKFNLKLKLNESKLQFISYKNIFPIASKIVATQCSFTGHLKRK